MNVTLNLATRPFIDLGPILRRLRIGMAILAVLSLLFVLGLHLFDRQAVAARAREHSLDGQIARVEAERQRAQAFMQEPANAQLLQQVDFLNDRFDEKSFSWTIAMEAMENVLPAGVQVSAIEPQRMKDGHIVVQLRILGPHDRSVDLVRNLEQSRRFLSPRIENESAESSNNPNQRVQQPVSASNRFEYELFADYNPPTPAERAALKKAASASAAASPGASTAASVPGLRAMPAPTQMRQRPPYTGPSHGTQKPNPAVYGGRR